MWALRCRTDATPGLEGISLMSSLVRGARGAVLLLSFLAIGTSGILGQAAAASQPEVLRVTIDTNAPQLSRFLGLGVEFDPYQFPPPAERWHTVLDRVAYAHFGFFRVMFSATDYCLGFDSSGKPIYVWQKPNPESTERFQRLLSILDFAQEHGVEVYLGEWSPAHELGIHSPADPRWPRLIADLVAHLIQSKHYTVIHHVIFFNEPNGDWMWPGVTPDFAAWSSGIRELRQELDRHQLSNVQLAGPDNSGGQPWFERSVRELNTQFGSWESHIYATDHEVLSGSIERSLAVNRQFISENDPAAATKDRFIAESGLQDGKNNDLDQQPRVHDFSYGVEMADYVAQIARAGWMGADAWDLDDAMHTNGKGGLKLWGFWDSTSEDGMAIRPWFYTWALMSRAFPHGSAIRPVRISPQAECLRATAATWSDANGPQASILLVNDLDQPRTVELSFTPVPGQTFSAFHYFENERPADSSGFPVPVESRSGASLANGATITLPGRGVILWTTISPK